MSGRLFEVVGSSEGSLKWSQEVVAAHGFDATVDKMNTVLINITAAVEDAGLPSTNMSAESSHVRLSVLDSQAYLKQYQIVTLPSLIVRTASAQDVVPFAPEDVPTGEGGTSTEELFAAAIAAYNEFNLTQAIDRFGEVLRLDPLHKQALFNLASILHMLDFPTLAVGYTVRLLTIDPDDVIAHSFLWALNNTGQCSTAAVEAYQLLSSRGDLRAATKLATLTGQGSQAVRGDPTYAQQIYDDMGESFETKLVDHLGYRGPWLMRDMLEALLESHSGSNVAANSATPSDIVSDLSASCKLRPKKDWRILDVGCGSGLCGEIFADYVQPQATTPNGGPVHTRDTETPHVAPLPTTPIQIVQAPRLSLQDVSHTAGGLMIGIDVSAKMVEITARKGVYYCAERWDLTAALRVLDCHTSAENNTAVMCAPPAQNADHKDISPLPRIGLDMVIAADTFIYVGALGEVFSLVRNVLRESGGLFMFSTEDLELSPMRVQTAASHAQGNDTGKDGAAAATSVDSSSGDCMPSMENSVVDGDGDGVGHVEIAGAVPGWGAQLLKSARFAHSDRYIRLLCDKHRFRVLEHRRIVLRTEETIPLPGNIYILQKL